MSADHTTTGDRGCLFDSAPIPADAPDGTTEAWSATEYARGPWDPLHCHGGPVSALLARASERAADGGTDWLISRLTIELTRPVPVGVPLALTTTIERPGRKVSVVAASLWSNGTEVAKVRTLRIRRQDFDLPPHPLAPPEFDGVAGDGVLERVSWATDGDRIAFHSHGAEHRIVEGGWNDPGPIKVWIRLAVDLVDGEQPSGVQRAAAAADFGNGVSSAIDFEQFLFINPDLTVHLAREPQGEWIGLATHSLYGTPDASSGAGFAESALQDEIGRFGRSVQSLFVTPR
ncbi:thioesterase family protein [Ilumatobacter sp.]|uniref:thioesterase family protein n=1 Tax=Ilumatobacter sp. TaxID=1967498 RepID=UPI003C4A0D7A